jgi:hypothetical protein
MRNSFIEQQPSDAAQQRAPYITGEKPESCRDLSLGTSRDVSRDPIATISPGANDESVELLSTQAKKKTLCFIVLASQN